MNIDVKIKANYEKHSALLIKFDSIEYYLTDREAESLLKQLYDMRPDLFESCDYIGKRQLESKVDNLEDNIRELEAAVSDLEDQVDNLEEENNELREKLENYE